MTTTTTGLNWKKCKDALPPQNTLVITKIDDEHGVRNEAKLKLKDDLWWTECGMMYVYYTPTHWANI